jgi:general secretion pathway protein I
MTDPAPPAIGMSSGEVVNGGRTWRWSRVTSHTPDQRLVRVDISVATSRTPSLLTIVRPAT